MPNVSGGSTLSKKSGKAAEAKDNFQPLLDHGTEMLAGGAATVTSAAIAWLLGGGPEAIAIGGTVGKGIQIAFGKVGADISSRQLGPREEKRVGATLIDVFYRSPLPVASSARFYNSVSRREKSTVCCVLLRRIFFVANIIDLIYNLACFNLQTASQYPIL